MNLYAGLRQNSTAHTSVCDLRSDTVTRPDTAMRAAMAAAEVGDDVYGEDPNINALEERIAAMLGKDTAVFFPTGTQSNLAAIMAHCGRGDEVIVGRDYHVYCDEAAGASVLAGIALCPIETDMDGVLHPDAICAAIKVDDPHYTRSRLLSLENTFGGQPIPLSAMQAASDIAKNNSLSVHLDGARFFNAITHLGCSPKALADVADTVSVCLSKGLGAPAGTVLAVPGDLAPQIRRNRKILGGGMRQVGILAAAALHALDHNIEGLAKDHERALTLAGALEELDTGEVRSGTNMVFFHPSKNDQQALAAHMAQSGILIGDQVPFMRMVLHRDVSDAGLESAIKAFRDYYS